MTTSGELPTGRKIFPPETIKDIPDAEINNVIPLLHSENNYLRTKAVCFIGNTMKDNYEENSKLLLARMNDKINFSFIRGLGIQFSWVYAIVLAENLKEEDYPTLKKEFDQWDTREKTDLLEYLKGFPEHIAILTKGHK